MNNVISPETYALILEGLDFSGSAGMNLENRMLLDSMKWDTSHAGLRLQEHKLAFPGRRLILSCFK